MKKKLIIALFVYAGLSTLSYFVFRSQVAGFATAQFNKYLDLVTESNSGVVCKKVEALGAELSLEFFYSTEFATTAFLLDPNGHPFKVTVTVTDPTFPLLRPLGLSRSHVSIKGSDIAELFGQRKFCEP